MNPTDRITVIPALSNQGGQANAPGLRRLWLIEVRYLLGMTDPRRVPGCIGTAWQLPPMGLQLSDSALIQEFRFPAERGIYIHKPTKTAAGVVYDHTLTLAVPRDHPTTALIVQRMTGREWVAIYEDANSQRKVIGRPKQPLRFLSDYTTTPNAYLFSWTGSTRQPAYFLNDDGLILGQNGADFTFGFSYDFFS